MSKVAPRQRTLVTGIPPPEDFGEPAENGVGWHEAILEGNNLGKRVAPKPDAAETLRLMLLILRILWQHAKRHPAQAVTMTVLIAATAALWVIEPLYSGYAVDMLLKLGQGQQVDLWRLAGLWALVYIAISLVQGFDKYLLWRHNILLEIERTQDAYAHALSLDLAFHNKQKAGEAIKTIEDGSTELAFLSRTLLELVPSILSALAFLVISLAIEPRLAAVLFLALSLYIGVVVFGTTKTSKRQWRINRLWVKPTGRAFDAIMNIASVKSAGREEDEAQRMRSIYGDATREQLKLNTVWALLEGFNFFMLTRILLVAIGVYLLVHGQLSLGELYFFQASFFRVLSPFEMLAGVLPQWNKSVGKVRMSQELLDVPSEAGRRTGGTTLPSPRGALCFEHVSFSYDRNIPVITRSEDDEDDAHLPPSPAPEGEPSSLAEPPIAHADVPTTTSAEGQDDVLHDITLTINAGEHVAIVGHSGAGKSTIAALINRFYDVTGGSLLFDGVDLRELDVRWWRQQVGLVLQENLMFHDTILENIRYARPTATRDDVIEAARRASADAFIQAFPQGYDTIVGERGVRLSGGERQRIAIARAILKHPTVVVLDEATSALDSVTEAAVQEGIRELIASRTAIIIAHRLSTVRSVDRIAVMEKGRLIACAPHDDLLKTCDVYRKMVELQSHGMLAE